MINELHEFDLRMCEYTRENILRSMSRDACKRSGRRLGKSLAKYLLTAPETGKYYADNARFLLSDDELRKLENFAEVESYDAIWKVYEALHHDSVACARAIRVELSHSDTQRWSQKSGELLRELERPRIYVADGVRIIRELLEHLRLYKHGIEGESLIPQPEGEFPTPTSSDSEVPVMKSSQGVTTLDVYKKLKQSGMELELKTVQNKAASWPWGQQKCGRSKLFSRSDVLPVLRDQYPGIDWSDWE